MDECEGQYIMQCANHCSCNNQYEKEGIKLPKLLLYYKERKIEINISFDKIKSQYSNENGLNEYFENIIKDALKQN